MDQDRDITDAQAALDHAWQMDQTARTLADRLGEIATIARNVREQNNFRHTWSAAIRRKGEPQ